MARKRQKFVRRMTGRARSVVDHGFDWALGVETRSLVGMLPCDTRNNDPRAYEAASWLHIMLLLKRFEIHGDSVVLDYGCGAGRFVCAAARTRAAKIIGVEINSDLVDRCRANVSMLRRGGEKCEIVRQDASGYHPIDVTHVFLFNPFGPETLDDVLSSIERAASAGGRSVRVMYLHPVHGNVFGMRAGWSQTGVVSHKLFKHPANLYKYVPAALRTKDVEL